MKKLPKFGCLLGLLAALLGLGLFLRSRPVPEPTFEVQTPFFSGKQVLVLVPHQDDEVCLVGGILEQYTRAGSRVHLAYATAGDYYGLAEVRSREALAAAELMGIRREDVYWLGYGNQWEPQGEAGHIYFAEDPDTVWTSRFGATATYGTEAIDPWRESAYTRRNFLRDLTELIVQLRPDVIYCNDYDPHHDHMALDLLFEEALGAILADQPDYRPTVYKGLCYGTAWYAEADFASGENLRSCPFPDWEYWGRLGIPYDWDSRVRLPMSAENLSPILSENTVFRVLAAFESQDARSHARSVLSGDKVFFQRRTDSLLYSALFRDGQEPVTVLNDFKLKDSEDFSSLRNSGQHAAEAITAELPEPVRMNQLRLHWTPEPEGTFGGFLRFHDDDQIPFQFSADGGVGVIDFPERLVSGFDLHFTDSQAPGLTEIEAFLTQEEPPQLLMAVDEQGDFVYDYHIPAGDTVLLRLWAYPLDSVTSWEEVDLRVRSSPGCSWELGEDPLFLRVTCPPQGRAVVTVSWSDQVQTTFTISNPTPEERQALLDRQREDLARIGAMD